MDRKRLIRSPLVWIALVLLLYLVYSYFADDTRGYVAQPTSVALSQLSDGKVTDAIIDDKEQRLRLTLSEPVDGATKIYAQYPAGATQEIFADVQKATIANGYNTTVTSESTLFSLLIYLIPVGLIILFLLWMMNNAQGGGNKVLSFGKSKAKLLTKDMPVTKFTDVAGADEAVEELDEIRDFLANPARYQALGAKIPKGVLLYGPPGTGKTLLARAVAGEAGVPFYSISGSDFVEMFVGVGASRVRDLFEQAKANAPAIIFVDEIDAVGRHRGAGMGGGHDEREQTLNQLLVEMDGFEAKGGIILIAATNRPDILDPALLRPGRFDRQIPVGLPDLKGRQAILAVHSKGKPFAPDVEFLSLAKRTVGMSGADLANVINEAALLTAREHGTVISNIELEESVDRVVGGPARKGKVISEKEKKITAYHEGGHALAAWAMPGLEPVYKVTILPRGRTGGHALVVPEDDKSLMTRSEMIARLVMALGGRAAEELVFAEPTTGASSDIAQATKIARAMVTEYGMSAKLGAVKYGHGDDEPFLGRTYGSGPEYSIEVGSEIDGEVRALIEAAHTEAWAVLNTYRDILDSLATALLEKETLDRKDLEVIFAEVEKRPRITTFDEFGPRLPSDRPPIKTPGELAIERGEQWPPEPETPPGPGERQDRPVPIGALNGPPGQSGYTTGNGAQQGSWQPPAGYPADPNAPAPPPPWGGPQSQSWTGGVLPGPLAPMPGWEQPGVPTRGDGQPGGGGQPGNNGPQNSNGVGANGAGADADPNGQPSAGQYPNGQHPNGRYPNGTGPNGKAPGWTPAPEPGQHDGDTAPDDAAVDPWAPPGEPRR
jgi:cell division protease FtsH